jgi:hypothetical protein
LTTPTARPSSASKAEPQKISTLASASNFSAPASPSNRLNTIASQFYRAFGDTAAAFKTAAVTVDGFTQGLFEKLNDSQSPLASNSSLPPKAPPLSQQAAQSYQTNDQNIPNDILEIRRESTDRFSSPRDRQVFENALTEAERGALEDYELQLAMALSLSTMDQMLNSSNVKTENTSSHKGSKVDDEDEIPLVRKKKNK